MNYLSFRGWYFIVLLTPLLIAMSYLVEDMNSLLFLVLAGLHHRCLHVTVMRRVS